MGEKRTATQHAQYLDSFGFNVVPAELGGKIPQVTWRQYQQERTTGYLGRWFRGPRRNYLVITGQVSRLVVLDLDNEQGEQHWAEILGDQLYSTARVRTAKGFHAWYRLDADQVAPRNSSGEGWDLRGEGGLVVAPPSVHHTGHTYEWIEGHGPDSIQPLPGALVDALGTSRDREGPQGRSMLSQLLGNPPEAGGRNDWLSRVAGHYASQFARFRDLYETHVWMANSSLIDPLDNDEVTKTLESIWRAEHRKINGPEPSSDAGWLYGRDGRLFSWERVPNSKPPEFDWTEWADFDLEALGAMTDEHGRVSWRVRMVRRDGTTVETTLQPGDLGTSQKFGIWCAAYKGTVPINNPARGSIHARVLRYLMVQNPPQYAEARWLGWHKDQGYITKDGVITDQGKQPFTDTAPAQTLMDQPWDYGMADASAAKGMLAEVLTYHDPQVCAVYGAWWAACMLKPQIQAAAGGMFPIMALEAPSESGKTTGFFGLMMELAGFTGTQGSYTKAAVQSALSVHANGPVWTDDMTDTSDLNEIIRQAAFSGSRTKKDADRHSQINEVFRAPWVLTGEALNGLNDAKALKDRVVSLDVPSPIGRMSLHDPTRTQWSDIEALREQNRFQDYAGRYVQMALEWQKRKGNSPTLALGRLRVGGSDRRATKLAVVRYGARLLAHLSGQDWVVDTVDTWAQQAGVRVEGDSDDALLLQVLPTVLRVDSLPDSPGLNAHGPVPAFYRDESVWINITSLAHAYARHTKAIGGRVEPHIHTAGALTRQLQAAGVTTDDRRQVWINGGHGTGRNVRYWKLPEAISSRVIERAGVSLAMLGEDALDLE